MNPHLIIVLIIILISNYASSYLRISIFVIHLIRMADLTYNLTLLCLALSLAVLTFSWLKQVIWTPFATILIRNMDSQCLEARINRRLNEGFRKQTCTMLLKGERLRKTFEAEVYIQIRRKGKFYIYTSTTDESWPASRGALVRMVLFKIGIEFFINLTGRKSAIHRLVWRLLRLIRRLDRDNPQ